MNGEKVDGEHWTGNGNELRYENCQIVVGLGIAQAIEPVFTSKYVA